MVTPQSAPPSRGRFVARGQGAIRVTVTRPYLPISSRSVDRVILIFKSAWNFLPANRNSCYDGCSFLCNRAAFLDRAPRDSSLAPTRTGPLRSAAWGFLCGRFHAAMPKGSRIPGAGRRWSVGPSPSPELDRDSGFADAPLPARPKAGRRRSSRTALRRKKTDTKFSCLQTPEISQNSEIFWRRRGHEEASRWTSAMTEGASPEVVPHGSRPTRRRNGGKLFLPANP
jgi:hypothetical protein